MIQPVSPVVPLPSPVIAVQSAPAPVEVASGPLPQPAASDALNFRDAVAASTVELNKVQEVTMQRAAPANQTWSHASKNLSETLNGMSALEDKVRQSIDDDLKPAVSQFADSSYRSGLNLGPDGPSESSSSGSSPTIQGSLEELEKVQRKALQEALTMGAFTLTAELLVRSSTDIISSAKQLANGGGG